MNGMPGAHHLGLNLHNILTRWDTSPFALVILAVVLVVGVWYVQSVWALSARGRSWSGLRTTSVPDRAGPRRPGAPVPGRHVHHGLLRGPHDPAPAADGHRPPAAGAGRADDPGAPDVGTPRPRCGCCASSTRGRFQWWSHPLPTAAVYYFSMFAFFLTSAVDVAMTHMWLMDVVNIAFLVAAMHFWWPIVGVDHIPHWPMGHGDEDGRPPDRGAHRVVPRPRPADLHPPGRLDVHGVLAPMRVRPSCGSGRKLFTFLALIPVFVQWLRVEGRRTARIDAELDAAYAAAGSDLTPVGPDGTGGGHPGLSAGRPGRPIAALSRPARTCR